MISTEGVDKTTLKSYVCLVYSERIVYAEGIRREKDIVRKTILLLLVYAGSIWTFHQIQSLQALLPFGREKTETGSPRTTRINLCPLIFSYSYFFFSFIF